MAVSGPADVDAALERLQKKTPSLILGSLPAAPAKLAQPSAKVETKGAGQKKATEKPGTAPKNAAAPAEELDFDSCTEKIWEQLIAAPPSRGRSMTTIRLGTARILMSSWEVSAFVSEGGASADDLQRAVVARALVTAAIEFAKESGNASWLDRALPVARVEVSRLQERVDLAKRAKDTETAVNLGISAKRLLSALDEAEKL